MTDETPLEVASRYADSIERIKKLSYGFFPSTSVKDFDPYSSNGTGSIKQQKNFQRVQREARPRHNQFYSASMKTTVRPTQSQKDRLAMQRMLEEKKLSTSEKKYFTAKIQRKIKEFKQKSTQFTQQMQTSLNRTGMFADEINHLRSSSMQTVIMRNMVIKSLPTYIDSVRSELKDMRNGQSFKVILDIDKAAQVEYEKERRQDLLVRLKKAVTNQTAEPTTKRTSEAKDTNLQGKLDHIINDKLPLRRVKPIDIKLGRIK
jgi:hypothetical protein